VYDHGCGLLPGRILALECALQLAHTGSEIAVTFPDPYPPGAGQEGIQPPPNQGYNQPPPNQDYQPADQGYGQAPPNPGLPAAPPVPAEYGYGQYPAAAVPQGMYFDQVSGLMLPDGTQLASVGRRIGSYFLAIPLAIVTLGIGYIIWGLIVWGNGQTPTQQVLGMRCWRPETNQVPGFWYMALREIVGGIVTGILGFITEITSFVLFLTGREHKAIHDYIAGTVVLSDPNKVLAS
jgi:uncharacterized RDD family membrane protein YckC